MARAERKTFTFTITYFKESGKYYTHTEVDWEIATIGPAGITPYMYDAVAKLRGLRGNGPESLPGLNSLTGDWDGYIVIDCAEGFPCLILPEKEPTNESL